jgi:tetratricopeptide (TPR) repeat protein
MRKDNVMFVVLGLIVGLAVGFMGANSINRSDFEKHPASTASSADSNSNPVLPPDHPPLGSSIGEQPKGGPRPEVMAAIEKAKAQPQNYEIQMTAADLYYQIQRFDEAAKFYEAATKLKPGDSEPMVKAGNAYFDAEKYEQAEKWYLRAIEKDSKNVDVRTDLGLTFFLRSPRDIDRAIKEYKTSLSIKPDHEITLQNLALAYDEKDDRENFVSTIEKLRKINPNNPVVKRIDSE